MKQYDKVGLTDSEGAYAYDTNGNLKAIDLDDDETNDIVYTYDPENRLVQIDYTDDNEDPVKVEHGYDYRHRRISMKVTVDTTITVDITYVYDGDQVIAEYDGSDNLLRKFIYGPGIDEPICMIDCTGESDVWYFYHLDGLSSN